MIFLTMDFDKITDLDFNMAMVSLTTSKAPASGRPISDSDILNRNFLCNLIF